MKCQSCDRKRDCPRYLDVLHRKPPSKVGPALCEVEEEKPKAKETK